MDRNYRPFLRRWKRLLPAMSLLLGVVYVGVAYAALISDTPKTIGDSGHFVGSTVRTSALTHVDNIQDRVDSQVITQPGHSQIAPPRAVPQITVIADTPFVSRPANPASELYSQYDNPADYADSSQNFEPALDRFDDQGADDFVVPTGTTWIIDQVEVAGAYRGSGPTDSVNLYIYANNGNIPGAAVLTQTNIIYQPGPMEGDLIIPLDSPVTLTGGTYWLSVQANQDYNPNGQWLWRKRLISSGYHSVWRNPRGGFLVYNDFTSWRELCNPFATCYYDLIFRLDGRLAGTPVSTSTGTPSTPAATRTPSSPSPTGPPLPPSPVATQYMLLPTATVAECGPAWRLVSSDNNGTLDNYLSGVAAVSANDVWAVGEYYTSIDARQTLVEHWDGSQWSIVPSPNYNLSDNDLNGVAAVSANDVWAVGRYHNLSVNANQTLVEHWDGSEWSIVPSPNNGTHSNGLNGLVAVSANDIWAVGSYYDAIAEVSQTLVEHWDGGEWSIVPSPNTSSTFNYLNGLGVVSPNDIWAVGSTEFQTLVEHWDGSQWSIVPSPNGGSLNYLTSIAAVSPNDIWAVGYYTNQFDETSYQQIIEHWDGNHWSIMPTDHITSETSLNGVVAISANDVWAVGRYGIRPDFHTLVEHWDGSEWSTIPSPNNGVVHNYLYGVAAISANDVWAVGYHGPYNSETLVERYNIPCLVTSTPTPTNTPTFTPTTCPMTFTDVPSDYPFYQAIHYLYCRNIVTGYGSTFLPGNSTTRGQLSKIIALARGWALTCPSAGHFSDVPVSNVFYCFVETAYEHGIISGYACGGRREPCDAAHRPYLRPNNEVSRGQLSKIIVGAMAWTQVCPTGGHFTDVQADDVFYCFVETAYLHSIISGYSDGTFRPNNNATRGQICKIVYIAVTSP